MQAELLHAAHFQHGIALQQLVLCETVFGIAGVVHDAVRQLENAAGIVPQADQFGQAGFLFQEIDVREIVQIDDRVHGLRFSVFIRGGDVRGEHHIVSGDPAGLGEDKFCH